MTVTDISALSSVRKLSDNQRAEIALLKDTRPTPKSTNKNIAADFGVSKNCIDKIDFNKLTDEQKAIYNQKRADLRYHCQDLTFNSILRAKEMLNEPGTRLSEVMGAAKIGSDIFRLEEGSATANIAVLTGEQAYLKAFMAMREKGIDVNDVLDAMRLADIPGVDDAAKAAGERAVRLIAGIEESS